MWSKIAQIWKIKDIRYKVLFILAMLFLYRLIAHIPIPGVDVTNLQQLFESNQVLGLVNLFSGGGIQNFSVIMVGVAPYITASIVVQLLTMLIPSLEELSKDGEYGRQKINQYTRWLTVPFALLQTFGMITLLQQSGFGVLGELTALTKISIMLTATAGTVFLMWIGELISEKKIGNGISILIFAGIISAFPSLVQQIIVTYDSSQLFLVISFIAVALLTIIGVVYISEGQRNIPISYGRQVRSGNVYGGSQSHLPLRVNQAGVIPIIFAISLVIFPPVVAQLFLRAKTQWVVNFSQWIIDVFQDQFIYAVIYFGLVVLFTYFYTSIIFKPDQIAENLQKQGAFIPGIRPGKLTSDYLGFIMNRIVTVGALFLGVIAILPLVMQQFTGSSFLAVGGTSLLIIVSVVIEIVNQINAQISMREYDY